LFLIDTFSHYSYRRRDIELLLALTDSFTWEELPTRDPETGNITNAGYIPIIQSRTKNIASFALLFHGIQSAVRIVISHEMIFPVWFPIDASRSPLYEIINFMQVMFTLLSDLYINMFDICDFFKYPVLCFCKPKAAEYNNSAIILRNINVLKYIFKKILVVAQFTNKGGLLKTCQ
jgi:hypothetical protein